MKFGQIFGDIQCVYSTNYRKTMNVTAGSSPEISKYHLKYDIAYLKNAHFEFGNIKKILTEI